MSENNIITFFRKGDLVKVKAIEESGLNKYYPNWMSRGTGVLLVVETYWSNMEGNQRVVVMPCISPGAHEKARFYSEELILVCPAPIERKSGNKKEKKQTEKQ